MPDVIEPWMREAAAQLTRCVWSDTFADPEAGVAEIIAAAYAAREQSGELRRAAQALADKLDAMNADKEYQSVWVLHEIHGGRYIGPKCVEELDALKSALAGESR